MIINADKAPKAVGPYSQGVMWQSLIYTSGQLPIDPKTGNLVEGGIEEQTKQALTNLMEIIKKAGSDSEKVLKTTVFLSDISNFSKMNEVYKDFFKKESYPARSAIQVAALPMNALIEIEAVAMY
ncbi:MAG: 2-iminobutanoate/2-iminopropanoate deaminase [Eubacteriales bacterium SKADARSKE-1]|nr:2-iminobutanoate/2-iminopropanoate deaminase [Eubacteriales bacterium SKADARSKE-1]